MANESEVISWIRSRARPARGLVIGIGDDAAAWKPAPGFDLLACCDLSVEDVHFRTQWAQPRQIGHKALAVTVSDVAAMGGVPLYGLVSMALPAGKPDDYYQQLLDGIFTLAERVGMQIIGGDTSASPGPLFLDTMVIGQCPSGRALSRSGAKPGDLIFVTGSLGASALGLYFLQRESNGAPDNPIPGSSSKKPGAEPEAPEQRSPVIESAQRSGRQKEQLASADAQATRATDTTDALSLARAHAIERHLMPEPQVEAGRLIGDSGLATAMIDISDGLSTDLGHIITESGAGAILNAESIPISECVTAARSLGAPISPLELALHGGEEYELLFTAAPEHRQAVCDLLASIGLRVSCIGEIVREPVFKLNDNGVLTDLTPSGFEHVF